MIVKNKVNLDTIDFEFFDFEFFELRFLANYLFWKVIYGPTKHLKIEENKQKKVMTLWVSKVGDFGINVGIF